MPLVAPVPAARASAVAYVTLPFAVGFLLGFAIPGVIEPLITADAYFGFVTTMFLAFGLVMEFPIVILLLLEGRASSARSELRSNRRYVFLGIVIFAVVVTPGGDPIQSDDHGARHVPLVRADDPPRGRARVGPAPTSQSAAAK